MHTSVDPARLRQGTDGEPPQSEPAIFSMTYHLPSTCGHTAAWRSVHVRALLEPKAADVEGMLAGVRGVLDSWRSTDGPGPTPTAGAQRYVGFQRASARAVMPADEREQRQNVSGIPTVARGCPVGRRKDASRSALRLTPLRAATSPSGRPFGSSSAASEEGSPGAAGRRGPDDRRPSTGAGSHAPCGPPSLVAPDGAHAPSHPPSVPEPRRGGARTPRRRPAARDGHPCPR